jgi:hypothetical protein
MDTAIVAAVFGAGGTVIAGLLAAVVGLYRRNGHQNPTFATLERTLTAMDLKLDRIATGITRLLERGDGGE